MSVLVDLFFLVDLFLLIDFLHEAALEVLQYISNKQFKKKDFILTPLVLNKIYNKY